MLRGVGSALSALLTVSVISIGGGDQPMPAPSQLTPSDTEQGGYRGKYFGHKEGKNICSTLFLNNFVYLLLQSASKTSTLQTKAYIHLNPNLVSIPLNLTVLIPLMSCHDYEPTGVGVFVTTSTLLSNLCSLTVTPDHLTYIQPVATMSRNTTPMKI